MILAFDTATTITADVAAKAKAANPAFQAIGRYYGTGHKLLTLPEARLISNAGLALFMYFERYAGRAFEGTEAGQEDGHLAFAQAVAIGQPRGTGICFTVDQDVDNPMGHDELASYFIGVRGGLANGYKIGCYGEGDVCRWALDVGAADYVILAGAMGWHGSVEFRDSGDWHGLQYPTKNALGIGIDPVDLQSFDAVGAWNLSGAITVTPQLPAPPVGEAVTPQNVVDLAKAMQEDLRALGLYSGRIDGEVGYMTSAAAMRAWRMTQGG